VAKKKKAARPASKRPRAARKAVKRSKSAASRRAGVQAVHRGLKDPMKVNLKFLKNDIRDHISALRALPQTDQVRAAVEVLDQAQARISTPCSPTMIFDQAGNVTE
jgi:hypothetical protein